MKSLFFFFCTLLLSVNSLIGAPAISKISPDVGTSAGGTPVTIIGSGFTGVTSVQFGGVPATTFSFVSDTTITATTPAHSPQVVNVTVTASGISPANPPSSSFVFQGNWQAYIPNNNAGTVSVIDASTNAPITTITLGASNPSSISVSPDGTQVFVTDATSNKLSVINTSTHSVANLAVQLFPTAVAVKPDGTQAYAVNNNTGTLSTVNTATNAVSSIPLAGSNPGTLAVTADGKKIHVTDSTSATVSAVNTTTTPFSVTPIALGINGQFPQAIVMNPLGTTSYTANTNSGTVSVIDVATNGVTNIPGVGNNPSAIAVTPDGTQVFAVNSTSGTVTAINTSTNTIAASTSVGGVFPIDIVIHPKGSTGYIVNYTSGNVSVLNTTNNTINPTLISVGSNPNAIALTPDGSKGFVTNTGSDNVSIFTTSNNSVTNTVGVGVFPSAVVITPDQAPLASFTATPGLAGQPSTFNASDSASPVGTIANYSWNFGDGTLSPVNTSSTISHVYTTAGTFPVTLTVTNSAGTSTQQIFRHTSSNDYNFSSLVITHNEVITQNGGPSATTSQSLVILLPVPTITSVNPNVGPTSGGTSVTITGTNFINVTTVLFGSKPALSFVVNSPTSITAISPPGTGTVDVRVTTLSGTSPFTPSDKFTYIPPPTVTNINPNTGPVSGGTSVTITGTNFTGATSVLFGSTPATSFVVNSATSITAISPPGTGTVDVTVTTPFGTSLINPNDRFTYTSPPTITSINPNSGPVSGGTSVTITGTNFTGATSVLFGTTPATSFVVNSDTSITAISPPEGAGTVNVRVITPFGTSAISPNDQFTFIAPLPPRDLRAKQVKNEFATQTDRVNILTWKAPVGGTTPVEYRIYRDPSLRELIGIVHADHKLKFEDHNRHKGHVYTYFIVTIDQFGNQSMPAKIVVK